MTSVNTVWATPDADKIMGYVARVSNPANQHNENVAGLLKYCARNAHWSVFEHAHACIEINTTRDIARQMIRHKSFAASEFSQRYADASLLGDMVWRECRLQDHTNRQNNISTDDNLLKHTWDGMQKSVWIVATDAYERALKAGIAKEQARALLPEGLTPSRLYMTGSIRSWVTYCQVRLDPSTQKEHREVAQMVLGELRKAAPITTSAFFPEDE